MLSLALLLFSSLLNYFVWLVVAVVFNVPYSSSSVAAGIGDAVLKDLRNRTIKQDCRRPLRDMSDMLQQRYWCMLLVYLHNWGNLLVNSQ